jgi:dTDP-4-dehydrorhamnose reductase
VYDKEVTAPLVIGADSVIGRELMGQYTSAGFPVIGTTRRKETISDGRMWMDLSSDVQSWRPPSSPSVAFLCAGVTSIEQCRIDPQGSRLTNVTNTVVITSILLDAGYFVVFVSTNLVYDGCVPFRRANDRACPLTEYGKQKAEVEERLLSSDAVSVVRVTKVLPPNMPLFVDWRNHLTQGETIRAFSNLVFSPVPLGFTSTVLRKVGEKRIRGIIQVSADRDITYENAAAMIAERVGANRGQVQGICKDDAPEFSTLDTSRVRDELHMVAPGFASTILAAAGL